MFLNSKFLKSTGKQKREEELKSFSIDRKTQSDKSEIGLFAPPMIDLVWCILIGLNIPSVEGGTKTIYEGFCEEIFGTRLDRPLIIDDKIFAKRVNYDYPQTMKYLKCFEISLKPFPLVWPNYSHQNYMTDLASTIHIQLEDKRLVINQCVRKGCYVEKTYDYSVISRLTNNIIDFYSGSKTQIETNKLSVKKLLRGPSKIRSKSTSESTKSLSSADQNSLKTLKKLWKRVETKMFGLPILENRLLQKYGIDLKTGISWICEFKNFFTLKLLVEKEKKSEGEIIGKGENFVAEEKEVYPCSIVEAVWLTYIELGSYYRKFSRELFGGRIMYPDIVIFVDSDRYMRTLKMYKVVFGEDPIKKHWESTEERFLHKEKAVEEEDPESMFSTSDLIYDDSCKRIPVNVFRLIMMIALRSICKNAIIPEIIMANELKNDIYTMPNSIVEEKRGHCIANSELFAWRVNYPNSSNVYFSYDLTQDGDLYLKLPLYGANEDEFDDAFCRGGIFFFPNPYDENLYPNKRSITDVIKENYDISLDIKKISLDNIADIVLKESNVTS